MNCVRIRLLACCSHYYGYAVCQALTADDRFELVALATDDPHYGRLSKRRVWRWSKHVGIADLVPNWGRSHGLNPFLGDIDSGYMADVLARERVDAIVSSCFGQLVPSCLLDQVGGRAYNVHPVSPGCGLDATRGPKGLEKALASGGRYQVALHRMSARWDDGEILATSDEIAVPPELGEGRAEPQHLLAFSRDTAYLAAEVVRRHLYDLVVADLSLAAQVPEV